MSEKIEFLLREPSGFTVLLATVERRDAPRITEAIQKLTQETASGNRRPVVVVDLDKVKFSPYLTWPGRNGKLSGGVSIGQQFASALAASLHLGCSNNEVANALGKIKRAPGNKIAAEVRGVSFRYLDDFSD